MIQKHITFELQRPYPEPQSKGTSDSLDEKAFEDEHPSGLLRPTNCPIEPT